MVVIIKWSAIDVSNCVSQTQLLINQFSVQINRKRDDVTAIALRRFLAIIISTEEFKNWEEFSLKRIQFCALINESESSCEEFIEEIFQICESTLEVARDYHTRYDSLEMIYHMIPFISPLDLRSQRFINLILLGMKWRPGRANEAIRRAACLCLSKALLEEKLTKESLLGSSESLLSLLKGCIEDDRSIQLRICSLQLLKIYFAQLQSVVQIEKIFELYPLVLARLDDSDDEVRIFAVDVFAQISACKEFKFSESTGKYIAEQLFLHMDDVNQILRERIYCLLKFLLLEKGYDNVKELAQKNLEISKHKDLCLKLIDTTKKESSVD